MCLPDNIQPQSTIPSRPQYGTTRMTLSGHTPALTLLAKPLQGRTPRVTMAAQQHIMASHRLCHSMIHAPACPCPSTRDACSAHGAIRMQLTHSSPPTCRLPNDSGRDPILLPFKFLRARTLWATMAAQHHNPTAHTEQPPA